MYHQGVMWCTRLIDDGDKSDDHDRKSFNDTTATTSGAQRSHAVAGHSIFSPTCLRFDTNSSESNNFDKDEDDCEIEDCVAPEESP